MTAIPEPFIDGNPNPEYIQWMQLSDENYHSDRFFINSTVIKKSFNCMAQAAAHILGIQDLPHIDIKAALAGSLFHTKVLQPHLVEQFLKDNQEDMLSSKETVDHAAGCDTKCKCPQKKLKSGGFAKTKEHVPGCDKKCKCPRYREVYAEFKHIDTVVEVLRRHEAQTPELAYALKGDAEKVMVGQIAGVWCKAKFDIVYANGIEDSHITDLKTAANFHSKWDEARRCRVSWYDFLNYTEQLAFYREIFMLNTGYYPRSCYIVGMSKETIPDIDFLNFAYRPDPLTGGSIWNVKMKSITEQLEGLRYLMSRGEIVDGVPSCGRCKYCRTSKVLIGATVIDGSDYGT